MAEDQKNINNEASEATATSVETKNETELLTAEVTKWKNEYLYLRAEFENYKKNSLKERSDLIKFGPERIARDILEVSDNFERALDLKTTPETIDKFKQGIEMTAKELKAALTKHGITEIPSLGQPFNPHFFEAISSEETTEAEEGSITQVFKKAYKLHDKTIRMGQVVVATKPKKNASDIIN
jgi:molecular chaperone GrpE